MSRDERAELAERDGTVDPRQGANEPIRFETGASFTRQSRL